LLQAALRRRRAQRAGDGGVDRMDVRGGLAEQTRQFRTSVRILIIAQAATGDGLAGNALHHIAASQTLVRLQHMDHFRRQRSRRPGEADQTGLGLHARGALPLHQTAGVAPQDQ
jgi:hypothetical protein